MAIYMPMIPKLVVAMLACARLGALHSIVVGICTGKGGWLGMGLWRCRVGLDDGGS